MNTTTAYLIDFAIIAAVLIGIARFRRLGASRAGNWIAAAAILASALAIVYRNGLVSPGVVVGAIAVGAICGIWLAVKVNMVQIPAMIAFQHGAGSIAVVLVSFVELTRAPGSGIGLAMGLSGIFLGSATLSASMIASAKLAKLIRQKPVVLGHHGLLTLVVLALAAIAGVAAVAGGDTLVYKLVALSVASLVVGALVAIRVGGADMPVMISFLNASAGLAAAFCGVAIGNRLLASCGAVVTSSGSILSYFMCKAMNRSLVSVLFGGGPSVAAAPAAAPAPAAEAPAPAPVATADPVAAAAEAAVKAESVVIVPGYGMAEGQAQAQTVALANLLAGMGKRVQFAIHPVAGRMPGHMHVLLAEADADPDMMIEIDEANQIFPNTDLAVIIGSCDVVNPAAISVPGTPISGMPILRADEARTVVVCNLDERPGYSGVPNPLYSQPNAVLLFGDAKKTLTELLGRITSEPAPEAAAPASVADPVAAAAEAAVKASSVVIVPGYGMAEGHAQAQTVALANLFAGMGKRVQFAIHPVAGRMPGHMHVLLAEADADPDMMIEIDEANQIFPNTDLVVIVGSCDVVNPAAISAPGTPISGMPILRADQARTVIVCNLDERPGYSGVENPLYRQRNAILIFGDASKTLADLLERIESDRKVAVTR